MTVREIINALLKYEPDEECEIVENFGPYGEEVCYKITRFGNYTDLPFIIIEKDNK